MAGQAEGQWREGATGCLACVQLPSLAPLSLLHFMQYLKNEED